MLSVLFVVSFYGRAFPLTSGVQVWILTTFSAIGISSLTWAIGTIYATVFSVPMPISLSDAGERAILLLFL